MKKTRFLVLVLALMLLIAGAVGVSVAAEGEPSLSIAKKNVSFTSSPILVFAVEADGVAKEDIELHVFESKEATEYYNATYLGDETIDEVTYHTYYIDAVAPKDIANEVYVQAVAGEVKSEKMRYSVLEFALEGIAKYAGVADKERVLAFYQSIIDYSSGIQYMLGEKFDGINAADYRYVDITNGTVDGKSNFITTDDIVTVSYTGTAIKEGTTTFNGWKTTIDGVKSTSGNAVKLGQVNKIEPNLVQLQNQGQEMDGRSLSSNKLSKLDFNNFITAGNSVKFVKDPVNSANTVLKIERTVSSGNPSFYIDYTGNSNLQFARTVLEFRILIVNDNNPETTEDNLVNSSFLQVGYATGNSILQSYNLNHDSNGYSQLAKRNESSYVLNGANDWYDNSKTHIKDNEWATVRLEYYNTGVAETTRTELFINGVSCGSLNCYNNATANSKPCYEQDVHRVFFTGLSGINFTIYIDNPSLYQYEIAE